MPTVLRKNGFSVRIYTNDHEPAHVHIIKGDGEAKIDLGNDEPGREAAPTLLLVWGMTRRDAKRSLKIASEYQTFLLSEWRRIHG